jgi:membrane associated rhomboid family serine protease
MGLHIIFSLISMTDDLFQKFGSSAVHIVNGEFYRTVTSLMLHNGTAHLAGNMVGVALFGTAVCTITGVGIGWLMILTAGAGGNLCNAFFYHSGHLSVGASTAVFGAVGILCSEQFFKRYARGQGQKIKAWIPLAGGLALLGLLGTGVRSDLMAHLFGFLVGLVVGFVHAVVTHKWSIDRYQFISLTVALCIVTLAFIIPLM